MGTERVVEGRHADPSIGHGPARRLATCRGPARVPRHIAGHIQRGGGTGPMKPRQPLAAQATRTVPIPERCGRRTPADLRHAPAEVFHDGSIALKCRECGAEYRSRRATSAPLLRARWRSPTTTRRSRTTPRRCGAASRPARRTCGATRTSCRSAARPGRRRRAAAGRLHAAGARRPAGRAPRPGRGVGQERHRQPDALVQGPRGRGRARRAPASSASTRSRAPRPGNLANAVAAHGRRARACRAYVFIPSDLEEQKVLGDRRLRHARS